MNQSQRGAKAQRDYMMSFKAQVKIGTPVVAGGIAEQELQRQAGAANAAAQERTRRRQRAAKWAGVKAQHKALPEVR